MSKSTAARIGRLAIEAGLCIVLETAYNARKGELFCAYHPPLEEVP